MASTIKLSVEKIEAFSVSVDESCMLASREPVARFYFAKLFILKKSKETAHL